VLVTGGAGFIGRTLAVALARSGHKVRALDALVSQVHGGETRAVMAGDDVELIVGDVRDAPQVGQALDGIEVVYHLAAEVGVAQSMYEISRYVSANTLGAAVLLEEITARRDVIRRVIVASSMSTYGEGLYRCPTCGLVSPPPRSAAQLSARDWELRCPQCHAHLTPVPTPESKLLTPSSVYAITKQDHEQLALVVGRAYNVATVALRFFNVYGPGQSLSNPYTGACAIFTSRLLNGQPPVIFEDGLQSRDFIHVDDVVRALTLAMTSDEAVDRVINIGTGHRTTVADLALLIARSLGGQQELDVRGQYREGDIRHCIADTTSAREHLGFEATIPLDAGIHSLVPWLEQQHAEDRVAVATRELEKHGLVR
jgi:dTDP-L-rhamnose 4-epimerase